MIVAVRRDGRRAGRRAAAGARPRSRRRGALRFAGRLARRPLRDRGASQRTRWRWRRPRWGRSRPRQASPTGDPAPGRALERVAGPMASAASRRLALVEQSRSETPLHPDRRARLGGRISLTAARSSASGSAGDSSGRWTARASPSGFARPRAPADARGRPGDALRLARPSPCRGRRFLDRLAAGARPAARASRARRSVAAGCGCASSSSTGAPAAAYLGWRLGSRYCVYQSGFDPAYAGWSPGALLLNDTIRSAIDEQAGEVDLLLGGEPYKWRFAPERRAIHTLYLVGAMRPARLLASSEAAARRRGRRLLDRPRVGRALRAIAARLPGA